MNENTAKLVAALKSDEYQQGAHYLRPNEGTYCCLGVACDLYRKENPGTSEWDGDRDLYQTFIVYGESDNEHADTELPEAVREWLGWDNNIGVIAEGSLGDIEFDGSDVDELSLVTLNDTGVPFAKIAEVIERQWA